MVRQKKLKSGLLLRSTYVWFGLFILAFVNGAIREFGLKKGIGVADPLAHQLSCVTGVIFWTTFTVMVWKKLGISRIRESVTVGLGWFLATFLFETFVLNRNLTTSEILHTYNVFAGQFWGLVLLWIGLMPVCLFVYFKKK